MNKYFPIMAITLLVGIGASILAFSDATTEELSASVILVPVNPANIVQSTQRLCFPGVAPWVQVTTPNGGETFRVGQQITVQWKSCNLPVNAATSIALENSQDIYNQKIVSLASATGGSITNSGQAAVVLPSTLFFVPNSIGFKYGKYYKIQVNVVNASSSTGAVADNSDVLFTINQ